MNKKLLIGSLVAVLLLSSNAVMAKGNSEKKPEKAKTEQTSHQPKGNGALKSLPSGKAAEIQAKKNAVKEMLKNKAELEKLLKPLKNKTELNTNHLSQYETLIEVLQEQKDLDQAIDIQKALISRFYQKGEKQQFKKLGKLFKQAGKSGLSTFVNGEEVTFDVPPFKHGGRAMVPIRAISASLKADVQWKAETRSVTITKGDITITLYLDKAEAMVNGQAVPLDSAPLVKNGRLFLPLRFISEQLGAKVDYEEEGDIVIIDDEEETPPAEEQPEQTTEPVDPEQQDGSDQQEDSSEQQEDSSEQQEDPATEQPESGTTETEQTEN